MTAPALLGAGASGETPLSAQTSGRGRYSEQPECCASPRPCRGFVRGQTYLLRAPKHSAPASPWNLSLQRGTKRKSPAAQAQNVEIWRCSRPQGCEPAAPQFRHPRDTHQCGAPGEAGRRGPVPLALPASDPTLTSLGRCRQRQLGNEPRPRALSRRRRGAAGSAHQRGGNAGLAGHRPGRDPAFAPSAGYGWRPTLQPPGLPLPLPPVPERVAA